MPGNFWRRTVSAVRALVYGVRPDPEPDTDGENHLLRGLARTPMRLYHLSGETLRGFTAPGHFTMSGSRIPPS